MVDFVHFGFETDYRSVRILTRRENESVGFTGVLNHRYLCLHVDIGAYSLVLAGDSTRWSCTRLPLSAQNKKVRGCNLRTSTG